MDVKGSKNLEDRHDALSFVGSESFVKFYERVHDLLPKGADAAISLELNERLSARRTAIMLNLVSRLGEGQPRESATKLQYKLRSTWPLSNKAYDIVQHYLEPKPGTDLMTPGKPEYEIMKAFFRYKKTQLAGKRLHED